VDVSGSIDEEEAALQRRGYVAALQDERVLAAIRSGYHGRIAVTYVEWAGAQSIGTGAWTSISGAIAFALERFAASPHAGRRRVIDISGDGPNNHGPFVLEARERAVKAGITINGLPIINDRPSRWGLPPFPELDLYYEDCVIGGRGAFIVVADGFEDFAASIRRKLILEIAGLHPSQMPGLVAAAEKGAPPRANRPRPPCDIGERQRLERGYFDR